MTVKCSICSIPNLVTNSAKLLVSVQISRLRVVDKVQHSGNEDWDPEPPEPEPEPEEEEEEVEGEESPEENYDDEQVIEEETVVVEEEEPLVDKAG